MTRRLAPYAFGALGALAIGLLANALDWSGTTTFAVGATAVFVGALVAAPFFLGRRGEPPVKIIREEVRVVSERTVSEPMALRRSRTAVSTPAGRQDGHPSSA
jgi:hypothetical protein